MVVLVGGVIWLAISVIVAIVVARFLRRDHSLNGTAAQRPTIRPLRALRATPSPLSSREAVRRQRIVS